MTTKHATCTHPQTKAGRASCRRAGNAITEATTTAPRVGRTDAHRPSVFVPEDYDFSHTGTYSDDEMLMDVRREAARMMRLLTDEGWKADFNAGQCTHCGTAIIHYAIMKHLPSHTLIQIGETCLEGRFEMATDSFHAWRKLRTGRAARDAKAAKLEAFLAANPRMRDLLDYQGENDFLLSLSEKLRSYADLSERQVEAAEKALTRDIERAQEKAQRDARSAALEPLTAGKRTITGTIRSTKWVDSPFGYGASGSLKCLIEDAEGYRFWGTVPAAFENPEVGSEISLTATIQPSDDDPSFAFYKRPRLA